MEFVWRPQYSHLGRRTELFGHIFYDFDTSLLDILVDDYIPSYDPTDDHIEPNMTDPVNPPKAPQLRESDEDPSMLRKYLIEMSQYYRTKHLLLMVGSQENFEKSEYYF